MDLENPFFSSDEDSDFDLSDSIQGPRVLRPRVYQPRPQFFETLSEFDFRNRFRLSKATVLNLSELVDPLLRPRPRSTKHAISTINQVLLSLR